jgi:DNA modification methylase
MTRAPYWHDSNCALYLGDAHETLAHLPGGSADCIVTSPPY